MNDKPIKVGDRVRFYDGKTGAVLWIHSVFLFVLPDGKPVPTVWHIANCTSLPRTRKVERWVFMARQGQQQYEYIGTASTESDALKFPCRISAPVRVELEVEEET